MDFSTLFPYGQGDPTYAGQQQPVTLTDKFKRFIKYAEKTADSRWHWCFCKPPTVALLGLNMKQQHQLLSQANIYLQQHPEDSGGYEVNGQPALGRETDA